MTEPSLNDIGIMLGRLEGKVDSTTREVTQLRVDLRHDLSRQEKVLDNHSIRLRSLERWNALRTGAISVAVSILSFVGLDGIASLLTKH